MRRIPLLLLTAVIVLLAACEKESRPQIQISTEEVLLSGDASQGATFTILAQAPWSLTPEGEGFTVSPQSGQAGTTSVTVTPTQANTGKSRQRLGSILVQFQSDRRQWSIEVYQRPATASRTVLLYMPGRSLLSFYRENIERIRSVVSEQLPGDGRILICYQPQSHGSAVLQELQYDPASAACETVTLTTYDTFDTGDPESVTRLFTDAAACAPAENYGLIIGCHGKAWIPASSGALPWSLRAGGSTDTTWVPAPGAKQTRSFGDTGHELDITQLASILGTLPIRFDYLIFDDCFMASIETLYDLRHAVDYVVASPCEIMGAGFPYDRIMPHLFDEGELRSRLGETCREFWYFYEYDWDTIPSNEQSGCISLTVMSQLDALAAEMKRVAGAAKNDFEVSELQCYKGGDTKLFYDLGHFVRLSCGDTGVVESFEAQLEQAVPSEYRFHTQSYYSNFNNQLNPVNYYTGISTSEPETKEPYASDCRQTSWYLATH